MENIPLTPEAWLQHGILGALALLMVIALFGLFKLFNRLSDSHDRNTDRIVDGLEGVATRIDNLQHGLLMAVFQQRGTVVPLPPQAPPHNGRGDTASGMGG